MSHTNPFGEDAFGTSNQASIPYAAPSAVSPPVVDVPIGGLAVASQNRRFVNFIIDSVATRFLFFGGVLMLGSAYSIANGDQLTSGSRLVLAVLGGLLGIVILALYFIVCEATFGVTLGKLVTGTRVVDASGGKPSFGQIVGRSFARIFPLEPFSFLFGDTTTGWHDTLSGTRVVRTRS